jgi:hypothetical protein
LGNALLPGEKKVTETPLVPVADYLNKLSEISNEKIVFIFTDDYRFIDEWQLQSKEFVIHSLVNKNEYGYFHQEFEKQDKGFIKRAEDKLFAPDFITFPAAIFQVSV